MRVYSCLLRAPCTCLGMNNVNEGSKVYLIRLRPMKTCMVGRIGALGGVAAFYLIHNI